MRTLNLTITFGTEWGGGTALELEVENPKRRVDAPLTIGVCPGRGRRNSDIVVKVGTRSRAKQ